MARQLACVCVLLIYYILQSTASEGGSGLLCRRSWASVGDCFVGYAADVGKLGYVQKNGGVSAGYAAGIIGLSQVFPGHASVFGGSVVALSSEVMLASSLYAHFHWFLGIVVRPLRRQRQQFETPCQALAVVTSTRTALNRHGQWMITLPQHRFCERI